MTMIRDCGMKIRMNMLGKDMVSFSIDDFLKGVSIEIPSSSYYLNYAFEIDFPLKILLKIYTVQGLLLWTL